MDEIALGISLGWAAGISPGPLTALIVTTSLRRGFAGGARVAIAPLITDIPVIALTVFALQAVPDAMVRGLAVAGGVYLVWLGVQEMRAGSGAPAEADVMGGSVDLRRGALTNVLNPQMWIFWVTVGAPIVAGAGSTAGAAAFLGSFYLLLVGTKLGLAWLVGRSSTLVVEARWARRMAVAGGLALVVLGVVIAARGW